MSADNHYVTIASASPAPVPDKRKDVATLHYVARQPIFDHDQKAFGYELLFRDGLENAFTSTDADAASRATLDNSLLMGLDTLCDGRRAFVNSTRDTLIKGLVTLLPSQSTGSRGSRKRSRRPGREMHLNAKEVAPSTGRPSSGAGKSRSELDRDRPKNSG